MQKKENKKNEDENFAHAVISWARWIYGKNRKNLGETIIFLKRLVHFI